MAQFCAKVENYKVFALILAKFLPLFLVPGTILFGTILFYFKNS